MATERLDNLRLGTAQVGYIWNGTYVGLQSEPIAIDGSGGGAILLGEGSSGSVPTYVIGSGATGEVRLRAGNGSLAGGDLRMTTSGLLVPGKVHPVDVNPWAKFSASARAVANSVWYAFTAVAYSSTSTGGWSGGSNMTPPDPGYYAITCWMRCTASGRMVGAITAGGDAPNGVDNWLFDARVTDAQGYYGGTRILRVDTYFNFWVYCTPGLTVDLQAEAVRVGRI